MSISSATKPSQHAPGQPNTGAIIAVMLAGAVLLTFSSALYAGFVRFDDPVNVINNVHVRSLSFDNLRWMFTQPLLGHYQPLTWLSFAIDYQVWTLEPRGYHITNIAIHAVNAGLVYLLAARLLTLPSPNRTRSVQLAAALGAALFALHPLRVESVAWVTERRDVLSLMWLLLATLAYLRANAQARALKSDAPPSLWAKWPRTYYLLCILALALSLLSKAWGMTYFAVLLLLDWGALDRLQLNPLTWTRRHWLVIAEKVPMLLLGLAAMAMAARAQSTAYAMKTVAEWGVPQRAAQALYGLWFYIEKTLWPTNLSPMYEVPDRLNPFEARFVIAYIGVIILAIATLWLGRRWRAVPAAMLMYVVVLLPVLGIAQSGDQLVADRYSYVACVPLAVLAAAGLQRLLESKSSRVSQSAPIIAAICIGALGVVAWIQTDIWHDSESLWRRAATATPSPLTCQLLGEELHLQDRPDEAAQWLRKSLELDPQNGQSRYLLGVTLNEMGQFAQAASEFEKAIPTMRQPYMGYAALGVLYANQLNRPQDAEAALREAVRSVEQYTKAGRPPEEAAPMYMALGGLLKKTGRAEESRAWFEKAAAFEETREMAARALNEIRSGK
jgi:tetratricopeptide (TPR) repeat protein